MRARQSLPAKHPLAGKRRRDLFYRKLKGIEVPRQSIIGLYFVNYFLLVPIGFVLSLIIPASLDRAPSWPLWVSAIQPFLMAAAMTWIWLALLRRHREKYNSEAFRYNQAFANEVIRLTNEERLELSELWRGCSAQIQRDQHALHEQFARTLRH